MLTDSVGEIFILYFGLDSILCCGLLMWWKLLFNYVLPLQETGENTVKGIEIVRKYTAIYKYPTLSSCYIYSLKVSLTDNSTNLNFSVH